MNRRPDARYFEEVLRMVSFMAVLVTSNCTADAAQIVGGWGAGVIDDWHYIFGSRGGVLTGVNRFLHRLRSLTTGRQRQPFHVLVPCVNFAALMPPSKQHAILCLPVVSTLRDVLILKLGPVILY